MNIKKQIKSYIGWVNDDKDFYWSRKVKTGQVMFSIVVLPLVIVFTIPLLVIEYPFKLIANWLNK